MEKILASLEMVIEPLSQYSVTNQKSSIFQAILMEQIDKEYASELHLSQLHPYSQCIISQKDKITWRINTLNEEAYNHIIVPLMSTEFSSFVVERDDVKFKIVDKNLRTSSRQNLIEKYYFGECSRYIRIRFVSPTAFKSNGNYLFWPQLDKIYRSIMKKYDAFSSNETLYDEETLGQLVQYSEIIRYNIRSTLFHLEGAKMPSYVGMIVVKVKGPQALVNLANVLWRYAGYSGIGIKAAIGMGANEIIERRE